MTNLSAAQKRRFQQLSERVGLVTQSDRRFFERFPHRRYRLRIASEAEIEQAGIILGCPMSLPANMQHFSVVQNVSTGTRARLSIIGPRDFDTDTTEDQARLIFDRAMAARRNGGSAR